MSLHLKRLVNDTVINVAQLLKEPVGATRDVDVELEELPLSEDLIARDITASARLTRVVTGILAAGEISGTARMECVRCLELFDASFSGEFDAEFRPTVDVRTGVELTRPDDAEIFMIDHNHELDLGELLRQVAVLSLPMQPICREDCPGIEQAATDGVDVDADVDESDQRFAVLKRLLDENA